MEISLTAIGLCRIQLCGVSALHVDATLCFLSINSIVLIWAILAPLLLFYIAVFSKLETAKSSMLAKFAAISGIAALLAIPVYLVSYFFVPGSTTGFGIYYAFSLLAVLIVAIIRSLSSKK